MLSMLYSTVCSSEGKPLSFYLVLADTDDKSTNGRLATPRPTSNLHRGACSEYLQFPEIATHTTVYP